MRDVIVRKTIQCGKPYNKPGVWAFNTVKRIAVAKQKSKEQTMEFATVD